MAITDSWLNPLSGTGNTISVLGFREDLTEFPHDIYSYYLSSIRDADIKNVRLLWRWLQGMQREFEHIYGMILNLPTLYSPDNCPEYILEYLRHNIGITDDLDYMWGELTTNEKRRMLKYFVFFLTIRSTGYGFEKIIENITGRESEIWDYFDFRYLLSGDSEYEMEGAIGREDLGYDPWMLSEATVPFGIVPDDVSIVTIGTNQYYEFTIDTLVTLTLETEPPVPPFVRLSYQPTRLSFVAAIFLDGGNYKARSPANEFFGQTAFPYNEDKNDFRVGFDADPYFFDIRIVDDGTINRDLMIALARFGRPISERINIRYYLMIDKFDDSYEWDEISGTSTFDNEESIVTLGDASSLSIIRNNFVGADEWTDYSLSVKAMNNTVGRYFEIRFYWQDANNYLYFRVTPSAPPSVGFWAFGRVVAGVLSSLKSGFFSWFDIGVDYFWRIVCVQSGSNLIVQLMQDEILLDSGSYASPWVDPKGRIELVGETNGEVVVSYMDVHSIPMVSDFIGP
jgi:hypothetical protein